MPRLSPGRHSYVERRRPGSAMLPLRSPYRTGHGLVPENQSGSGEAWLTTDSFVRYVVPRLALVGTNPAVPYRPESEPNRQRWSGRRDKRKKHLKSPSNRQMKSLFLIPSSLLRKISTVSG